MPFAKSLHQRHRPFPQKSGGRFQEGASIDIVPRGATEELAERPHEAIRFLCAKHGFRSRNAGKGSFDFATERKAMSIRSTLLSTFMAAAAIATLGIQAGPAFADGGYSPCTGNKKPHCYSANGACDKGRPQNEQPLTPTQQNDWWWGGAAH
jgi:hypothetical protein